MSVNLYKACYTTLAILYQHWSNYEHVRYLPLANFKRAIIRGSDLQYYTTK